jgi:hypothetical protein
MAAVEIILGIFCADFVAPLPEGAGLFLRLWNNQTF